MTLHTSTASVDATSNLFSLVAKKHRDGTVLLSTAADRICRLNGAGALTWLVLEQSTTALTIDEIVGELERQFENVNDEGKVLYDVSTEQLKDDTSRFVNSLVNAGLLEVLSHADGEKCYRVKAGITGTTSATVANVSSEAMRENNVAPVIARAGSLSEISPPKHETLAALWRLFAFDLLLRTRGFEAFIRRVESWPIAEPQTTDAEVCRLVCASVNRAQMYYPKKAMCLQHSAVVTCLLRRKGVPAQMVLAAQEFPPKAHAWAEVAGTVVNDSQQVKTRYRELRRI